MEFPEPLPPDRRRELAEQCVQLRGDPERTEQYRQLRQDLVGSMLRLLYKLAQSIDPDNADELLSEGTIAALEAVETWRPKGGMSISSWIRWKASLAMAAAKLQLPTEPADLDKLPCRHPGPEEIVSGGEILELAARRLPKTELQAIVLYYAHGLTFERMGEELKISPQAAHKRFQAGMKRLRNYCTEGFE